MRRRALIAATAAGVAAGLAAPAVAQQPRVLRFVPQAALAETDPHAGSAFVTRNHAQMVFDTLYGVDAQLAPRPQMAEGHELSADRLGLTITLREGLRFHDGTAVRAADCVASLRRWMPADPMGQEILERLDELAVLDDRRLRVRLSRPYAPLLFALGKTGAPIAAIMPERLAARPDGAALPQVVGSGPFRFRAEEFTSGQRAVYERFAGYAPRAEPGEWTSGAKQVLLDRVEWQAVAEPEPAAALLLGGQADWLETPGAAQLPALRRTRALVVDQLDPLGSLAALRLNHLHPPFDHPAVRQAVMLAFDQADAMRVAWGSEETLWRRLPGFFTPETPLFTEAGGEALAGPRDPERARRMISEAGHAGTRVVLLVPADVPVLRAISQVTALLLRDLGLAVEAEVSDWATVVRRRAIRAAPADGGWNAFHTWFSGIDTASPAAYAALRANGPKAWFGWPEEPEIERLIDLWSEADSLPEQRRLAEEIQRRAFAHVMFVPAGMFYAPQAWRRSLTGVQKAPLPIFWGVAKT